MIKKIIRSCIFFLLSVFLLFSFSGCNDLSDKVIQSLGKHDSVDFYRSELLEGKADYAIYTFEKYQVENNKYFSKINEKNSEDLYNCIDAFEKRVEQSRKANGNIDVIVEAYDFDKKIISESDYLYIDKNPDYPEFYNFSIYFLDVETSTLYYFHNEI